jgi:hypothetical protein
MQKSHILVVLGVGALGAAFGAPALAEMPQKDIQTMLG